MNPVTLQINVTADDLKHCKYLLPHQLDLLHEQVSEVLLTFDTQPQKVVSKDILSKNIQLFQEFLKGIVSKYPKVRVHDIDYSKSSIEKITKHYFNRVIPTHDFRGAPIYGYLSGIFEAKYDYIFHLDSDMFFGGMSKTWIAEAIEKIETDELVFSASPLPGPPHPEEILKDQKSYSKYNDESYAFEFDQMSTRIVLFNRKNIENKLVYSKPILKNQIFSKVMGFANAQTLEIMITNFMRKNGFIRVDFKGKAPGLWSVHPLLRSTEFYNKIPEMIDRVVKNDVPVSQLGAYNFSMDFIDWSEALENFEYNRLRNRLLRKLGLKK